MALTAKVVTLKRFASHCQEAAGSYREVLRKDPCAYCGWIPPKKRNRTLDHIVPDSKGGPNGWENKTLACLYCNRLKGNRDLLPFLIEFKKQLDERRDARFTTLLNQDGSRINTFAPTGAPAVESASSADTSWKDTPHGYARTEPEYRPDPHPA